MNNRTEIGYVYELPTTEAEAWDLIQQERSLRTLYGGYSVGPYWFHSDLVSRSQQTGLLLLGANVPPGLMWKTMSREKVPLTQELAQGIFFSAVANDGAVFDAAEQVMRAATASGDYSTFDYWSTGWPPAYWEVPQPVV